MCLVVLGVDDSVVIRGEKEWSTMNPSVMASRRTSTSVLAGISVTAMTRGRKNTRSPKLFSHKRHTMSLKGKEIYRALMSYNNNFITESIRVPPKTLV